MTEISKERKEELGAVSSEIRRRVEAGEISTFDAYREMVIPRLSINRRSEGLIAANQLTAPEAFEIAIHLINTDYRVPDVAYGIVVVANALGLHEGNMVEELRPFLESEDMKRWFSGRIESGLTCGVAEDFLGLRRDTLYRPFTNREWLKGNRT